MYKVLHYVVGFSTLSETFIYDLITGLEERKISSNIVVCRKRTLEKERPFKNVVILKEPNPLTRLYYKVTDADHMKLQEGKHLKKIIEEFKPDLIHAHFGIAGIRINNFVNYNKINIPVLTSFHGSDVLYNPHNQKGYLENLLKLNQNQNLTMTVPTNFLRLECEKIGLDGSKIKVMNNSVNKMFLNAKQAQSWDGKSTLKFVIVGRLVPMKGHEIALKALHKLKRTFDNFELYILGDGRTKEGLEVLTKELNLENHVYFLGAVNHTDLPELLSQYHVSLTPSVKAADGQEESFCISLVEASLIGLYCLASDAGGPNEVLKDKREFIYPQKDSDALEAKLREYVVGYGTLDSRREDLKKFMSTNYHPDEYFRRYDNLYKSIQNR